MAKSRLYIPALGSLYDKFDPYALPLLRVIMGLILIPHGLQKSLGWFGGMGYEKFNALFDKLGYHPGIFWNTVVLLTEIVGGTCLVLGLFTRAAALFLLIFMINAVIFLWPKGFFWTAQGWEYSLLIGTVALVFLIRGGGKCSLDERMGREF